MREPTLVFRTLQVVIQMTDLMGTSCRDEHCFTGLLMYPETLNAIIIIQLLSQMRIQIELLGMYRVMLILPFELFLEEFTNLGGVFRPEQIPYGRSWASIRCLSCVHHDIAGIRHVHV